MPSDWLLAVGRLAYLLPTRALLGRRRAPSYLAGYLAGWTGQKCGMSLTPYTTHRSCVGCLVAQEGASSFAAHMRTCTRALAVADAARAEEAHTLFLLDEPGASTDPIQASRGRH